VIHVQHDSRVPGSPLAPGQPGNQIKDAVRPLPDEPVLHKSVNSCFIGTDLEQRLRAGGAGSLVLCGLTTNHCVSTTARMAGNLGFDTWVVADATAAFGMQSPSGRLIPPDVMHEIGLTELKDEFATIADTEQVLALLS
jgi:nicotinamidase-related amidase